MNLFLRGFIYVFLFSCAISCSREKKKNISADPEELKSTAVKSLDGKIFLVGNLLKQNHITVFYFLMPGCPMCESYTRTINELENKYSDHGITFCGIFSSYYYSDEEIISFRDDHKITIPFYRDMDFKFTHTLGAEVTPEVFVLDSAAAVLYCGSIDNLAYATGKVRMEATEFFLNNALENIVNGKPVALKSTEAYGCIIE